MNTFVGEEDDLEFYSGFNWDPVQRCQYGGKYGLRSQFSLGHPLLVSGSIEDKHVPDFSSDTGVTEGSP